MLPEDVHELKVAHGIPPLLFQGDNLAAFQSAVGGAAAGAPELAVELAAAFADAGMEPRGIPDDHRIGRYRLRDDGTHADERV